MADDFWLGKVPPSIGDFDALARYNAERGRGLVHHPAWDARMSEIQDYFNRVMLDRQTRALDEIPTKRRRWWQA